MSLKKTGILLAGVNMAFKKLDNKGSLKAQKSDASVEQNPLKPRVDT